MSNELKFDSEALNAIMPGFDKLARAIGNTLGPKGRNVFLDSSIQPRITNDGSTIANSITLSDKYENTGAWWVKNSSSQTNADAGDGTTTTAVLLHDIVHEALKRPENPMIIKESLQLACKKIIKKINKLAIPITLKDIKKIALISSESEEIAELVSSTINKIGIKSPIIVEESRTFETSVEIQEGYEAEVGMASPEFVTESNGVLAIYDDVHVMCAQKRMANVSDIMPLSKQLLDGKIFKLVIICEEMTSDMMGIMTKTFHESPLKVLVINAKGTLLEDMASTVGASIISDSTGINFENLDIKKHLGKADKVICSQKKTLLLAKTKEGKEASNRLKAQAAMTRNMFERDILMKRAAKLSGGIAVLKIGAVTDSEKGYKKDKTDDTVAAVRAALEEGVVEGGGMALWRIAQEIKPKTVGEQILKKSLTAPLRKICENAAVDYAEIVMNLPKGMGYDAKNNKYVNMLEAGIIDPKKVERVSLENAVSNAAMLITTHCIVCDEFEPER